MHCMSQYAPIVMDVSKILLPLQFFSSEASAGTAMQSHHSALQATANGLQASCSAAQ